MIPAARLYIPTPAGFERHDRVPCPDADLVACGDDRSVYVSDGVLRCVGADEQVRFEVPLGRDDRAAWLTLDAARDALYVRTGKSLLSLDATSGKELGRKEFGASDYSRRVEVLSDGTVVCASYESVLGLNRDLSERWHAEGGVRAAKLEELQSGGILLVDDGYPAKARVLRSDGSEAFRCDRVAGHGTHVDARGTVWTVEQGESRDVFGSASKILRYEPSSGTVTPVEGTQATEDVIPLRDGAYVVAHRYIEKPRLILYGPDGQQRRSFSFGDDDSYRRHHIRQVLLRFDHGEAYAVIDREPDHGPVQHLLFRLDLLPGDPVDRSKGAPVVAGDLLYRTEGDATFQPAVLSDGRVLVYREGRIDVVDGQGGVTATHAGPASLAAALGPVTEDARRIRVGSFTDPDPVLGLRSSTDLALFRFHYDEPMPPRAETPSASEPMAYIHTDGGLDFNRGPADLTEAGFNDLAAWETAQVPRDLLNFAWRDTHEIPLPAGREGKLEISRADIRVVFGPVVEHVKASGGAHFVAVQPFLAGDRLCVAAATSDGMLTWNDTTRGPMEPPLRVDLGAPAQSMGLLDATTIRVMCTDGRVLLLTPPLATGESIRGAAAVTQPASTLAPAILVENDTVRIGGLTIPRKPR